MATVEGQREAELAERLRVAEAKLVEAEGRIAELSAAAVVSAVPAGRKTVSAVVATLLDKQGVAVDGLQAGSIDAALTGLSIEQRFAVKTELFRSGLLNSAS